MLQRDTQNLTISRQGLLLVTAMGVGLLTLAYVLGVQVGKQSASMRRTNGLATGEELTRLPAPLSDQLKPFEAHLKDEKPASRAETPAEKPAPPEPAKPEAKKEEPKPAATGKWTLQLVATKDPAEASRIAAKAKAAGYPTTTVKDKKIHKVRLAKASSKDVADTTAAALKSKGFKPFAVRID